MIRIGRAVGLVPKVREYSMTEIIYTFAGHPDLLVQSTYKKLGNPSDEKDMINRKKAKSKRSTNSTFNNSCCHEQVMTVTAVFKEDKNSLNGNNQLVVVVGNGKENGNNH